MFTRVVALIRSLPRRDRYMALAAGGTLVAIGAAYVGDLLSRPPIAAAALAVLALAWAVRTTGLFDELSAFWRRLPPASRAVLVAFCAAVLAGHAIARERQIFPLVQWNMYDERYEPERIEAFELYGVTRSGERTHINISRTFPAIRRGAAKAFTRTAQRLERTGDQVDASVLDQMASATASLDGRLTGRTYLTVEVIREVIHRDAPGSYRRSSHLFRTIPLAPAGELPCHHCD